MRVAYAGGPRGAPLRLEHSGLPIGFNHRHLVMVCQATNDKLMPIKGGVRVLYESQ